ncbi:hypothetical protein JD844_015937 [Phrynosoma platyrhinos]|uniref:Dpy-19 like 4 n=1 Tax=Phrynosoma platyrhinos TaxID=52577 RepID=A0ABQ7SJR0_PHRPL|nr:hypothetical protein JD844_015937 [Phrynosoma platyrhinos]
MLSGAVDLRQRKAPNCRNGEEREPKKDNEGSKKSKRSPRYVLIPRFAKLLFGCLAAVISGMMYAIYLSTYHERKFWFSGRPYKLFLFSPSFIGIYQLTHDNSTLSMKSMNAVRQMTLYPELIASILYQASGSKEVIEPVYFYIGIVFGLQGIYVTALFVTSWLMSGTWLAGMLTVAWFIINRADTTRIDYSIPLRENWALPYFACQVAALTGYLKNNLNSSAERFCYLLVSASTYTFMMMWEYSHYLLFVQAISLFLIDVLGLTQTEKVHEVYKIYLFSLFLGYMLQFENPALLVSPLLSLVAAALLAKYLQVKTVRSFGMFFCIAVPLENRGVLYAGLVQPMKAIFEALTIPHHEYKKGDASIKNAESCLLLFSIHNDTDFEPCSEAHQHLSKLCQANSVNWRSNSCIFFPSKCQSGKPISDTTALGDGRIGERPEVAYHVLHTISLGLLAMMMEGMKYVWTPYVCMIAAFGVCSPELWMTLFKWLRLKTVHPILLFFPRIMAELSELQEFYDPDTVGLMTWIKRQAPIAAVFAGSPQLMGVIKLCTGWMVTNLPLYNDEDLQKRNENIFQIYSKRSADDIYKILTSYKATYLIIEDSICNEVGPVRGCRVKDLLDIANGHVYYEESDGYGYSKYGRFCQEIKMNYSPYVNYFTRVYWNRSYYVYKINTVISFQS